MAFSSSDADQLTHQVNELGFRLAELISRLDQEDENQDDVIRSAKEAVGHFNEIARMVDPDARVELPTDWQDVEEDE